jgi:type 1 fimbria pilin
MKNKNGLKLLWQLAFALALSGTYSAAYAVCAYYPNQGVQVMRAGFGNVYVQRDTPVGTVLARVNQPTWNGNNMWYSCSSATGYIFRINLGQFNSPTIVQGTYATNISGVGIRILDNTTPIPVQIINSNMSWILIANTTVELVKTNYGAVGTGTITSGLIAEISLQDADNFLSPGQIVIDNASRIIPVKCSITTPNIQVPLADVMATDLTSPGMTAKPKQFNMGLNCDAGARVNAKLTGTQNSSTSVNGVLQLTGAGSASVASGVGIQLLYNNTPLQLNNNIVLKTAGGGMETFPFTARYYQTAARVTGGTANATATLEMTYQ